VLSRAGGAVPALLFLGVLLFAREAQAGGLYLFDRGARPLSRGGAWIAGADDPGALWYNPAGLSASRNQVLGDAVLTLPFVSFQRLNGDGFAANVDAKPTPIPIPTLAFSHNFGTRKFTFGAGIFAPNAMIINWPRSVPGPSGTHLPAPTRYSLIGLQGSILSNIAVGFSYKLLKSLSIGADVQLAAGRFKAETGLSACDGTVCTFPEDPDYDAYATIDAFPVYGVTGTIGLIYNLWDMVRWGVSVSLPYTLRGSGSLSLRMPDNVLFADAKITGDKAELSMNFPTIVRVGSEIRPVPYLRMEGAFVWEQWSRQKSIDLDPKGIKISNVSGIGDYEVSKVSLARNMKDVWSVRGGFELFIPAKWLMRKWKDLNLALRGGLAYETSSFDKHTLTPLTIDSEKTILSGGLSFDLAKWLRFDSTAGWIHMWNKEIRESTITQPTAIRPAFAGVSALGNGNYQMEAFFLGGGFLVRMD